MRRFVLSFVAGILTVGAAVAQEDVPVVEYPARARYESERRVILENFSDGGTFSGGKTVRIQLPPGYHTSTERYRVLYLFDGWLFFEKTPNTETYEILLDVDRYHDELLADGLIHPAILVAIDRGWYKDRRYELTPPVASGPSETVGGLEENYAFIVNKLKPYVDAAFRTRPEAEFTGVAGRSFGGIASFYLAYKYPETFGLAGCMSTSFGWDEQRLYKRVLGETTKSATRYWIQDGSFDSWYRSFPAYRAMVKRGWVEGDDIAYFHVHRGRHAQVAWNFQMRNMLHFLLRKRMPKPIGIRATNYDDDRGRAIDLGRVGGSAHAMLDVIYEDGLRLNAGFPTSEIADTSIAVVEDGDLSRIRSRGHGWTTMTMGLGEWTSKIAVRGYDAASIEREEISRAEEPVVVDGLLGEWDNSLEYFQYTPRTDQTSYRFGVKHDRKFLYIAVKAYDDSLVTDAEQGPREQDTIEFRIDARGEPERLEGRGRWPGWDHLYVGVSPGEKPIVHGVGSGNRRLPEGTMTACVPSDSGYVAEIAIPVAFLDEKHEGKWTGLRLNITQIRADDLGGDVLPVWWKAEWAKEDNRVGSGAFVKAN